MKNMYESGETFALYAQIDCCYWMLGNIKDELAKPKEAVTRMIDDATGYSKARSQELLDMGIDLVQQIIGCKKRIEAETRKDEMMLDELLKLKNQ